MLTLVSLDEHEIARIVADVPGGVVNVQDIYPLAPLQEGILFHHLMADEGDTYLLPSLYSFASRERLESLLGALQQVVNRHDILRTAIAWDGLSQPVQVVLRKVILPVEWLNLDAIDGELTEQLEARFDPQHTRIDVTRAPLLRCHVAEDKDSGRFLLHILAHHLVIDHTTVELLLSEAQAIEEGRLASLPVPMPFRNFVAQARLGVSQAEHETFFRHMLGDVDEPTAPFGLYDVQGHGDIGEARLALDDELTRMLRQRTRALGVSVASLVHLAWALVLARTTGRQDVVFGTVLFGRLQAGAQADQMLGMFINTLPLRLNVTMQGVETSLKQTHGLLAQLLRHEHASLALAQRCSGVDAQMPLFTSLLNFRHTPVEVASGKEVANADEHDPDESVASIGDVEELGAYERSNYPLGMSVDDLGVAIVLTAQVSNPLDPHRICAFMETALREVVYALHEAPQTPLALLNVLPSVERDRVLFDWNETGQRKPEARFLHELFEVQAERDPHRIAMAWREGLMSYGQLNARANRLAQFLRHQGVVPDSRVAICAERGAAMVEALLAVQKAGGAYVPLDPAYPADRLAYMLEDSEPTVILASGAAARDALARTSVASHRVVDLEADARRWSFASTLNHPRWSTGLTPRHLAYVIYTSGSTGQPKGVMNEHRGLSNLVAAQIDAFGITRDSRVLQFASPSFDASVSEVGITLAMGACLCLAARDDLMPGRALLQTLRQLDVTHVTLPPSALPLCAAERMPFAPSTLIVAGEAVSPKDANTWSSLLRFINAYGPTETTVCATTHVCTPEPGAAIVPIGKPIANMRIYILDAHQQPVPISAAGEIWIGGVGVARGYLNKPDLTEQRFQPDPFAYRQTGEPEPRMYRTGDLGRWREDGTIDYLGRNDFQVKIRGFRIELGEVEARLASHPAVQEAHVIAREPASGQAADKRLVAYYLGTASVEEVRAHAAASLPHYMLPSAYVCLEHLPLTPNGKLDRKALPAPEGEAFGRRIYEAPQGEVETTLAEMWSTLLDVEKVGRHDNFFELGGHSLLAVQLIARVRQYFDIELPLSELFLKPTLIGLAASVDAGRTGVTPLSSNLVPLRAEGFQRPVFFIHTLEGNVGYTADLVPWIDPEVPVYGLMASGLNPGEEPLRSVEAMATRYAIELQRVQPKGPYRIASWSAGGMVAYEIAHQLMRAGETVEFVGLIDTLFRVTAMTDELRKWYGDAAQPTLEERERAMMLVNLQHVLNMPLKRVKGLAQLSSVDEILAAVMSEAGNEEPFEIETYKRHNAMQCAFVEAIRDYQPAAINLTVSLFAASKSQGKDETLGWGLLLGDRLRVVSIKGDHQSIMQEPRIEELGRAISLSLPVVPSTASANMTGEVA